MRISANMFHESGVTPDAITAAVTRLLTVYGMDPEGDTPGSLDAVEVGWWSHEAMTPLATLRELAKMCEDVTETDEESGEVSVIAAKKIKALGVYDFDAECAPRCGSADNSGFQSEFRALIWLGRSAKRLAQQLPSVFRAPARLNPGPEF